MRRREARATGVAVEQGGGLADVERRAMGRDKAGRLGKGLGGAREAI